MILVNGRKIEYKKEMTVNFILKELNYTFPLIIVKINGKIIPKEDFDTFILNDCDDLKIIHLVAGG
jgi:thiamine biosynthesis protein ThiS